MSPSIALPSSCTISLYTIPGQRVRQKKKKKKKKDRTAHFFPNPTRPRCRAPHRLEAPTRTPAVAGSPAPAAGTASTAVGPPARVPWRGRTAAQVPVSGEDAVGLPPPDPDQDRAAGQRGEPLTRATSCAVASGSAAGVAALATPELARGASTAAAATLARALASGAPAPAAPLPRRPGDAARRHRKSCVIQHCTRAVYTAPIKTISNQPDFCGKFDVGLLT